MRIYQSKSLFSLENICVHEAKIIVEENLKMLKEIDEEAKKENTYKYRYFFTPDARAFYQIISISKNKARVRLCKGVSLEEAVDGYLGYEHVVKLSYATKRVKERERLEKLF